MSISITDKITEKFISFSERLQSSPGDNLIAEDIEILQINIGLRCNLSCRHCHLSAGPDKKEMMSKDIMKACIDVIDKTPSINTVDITGGAPELNPDLEWLLIRLAELKRRIIVRSNLTVLEEGYEKFKQIYRDQGVEIFASLPDVRSFRMEKQRGTGTFNKIMKALKSLNDLGYADKAGSLILNLVHNPPGAYLPGIQSVLEAKYRKILREEQGVEFNSLFCITNMPMGRYLEYLQTSGNFEEYIKELIGNYNPKAAAKVMCRNTISVSFDGTLYDCDFNQAINTGISVDGSRYIRNFDYEKLSKRKIAVTDHCYACTAGLGSSCQGVVEE